MWPFYYLTLFHTSSKTATKTTNRFTLFYLPLFKGDASWKTAKTEAFYDPIMWWNWLFWKIYLGTISFLLPQIFLSFNVTAVGHKMASLSIPLIKPNFLLPRGQYQHSSNVVDQITQYKNQLILVITHCNCCGHFLGFCVVLKNTEHIHRLRSPPHLTPWI